MKRINNLDCRPARPRRNDTVTFGSPKTLSRTLSQTLSNPTETASTRYNSGFSLIELLAVIAIISILAGMIGVAAHSARMRAYSTLARMEAQQIATAFKSYWVVKGQWPTVFRDGGFKEAKALTKTDLFKSDLMGAGTAQGDVTSSPFLEISEENFAGSEEYLDAWGHAYTVKIDPTVEVAEPETFQIVVGFINAERYYYQE